MAVIKITVPKTPKSAFNKNRPASDLLKAQLDHLEAAAGNYRPSAKKRGKLTEGQAAARIHALTRTLHPQAAHVPMPTVRMISHAEDADPVGDRTAAGPRRRAARKPLSRTSGRQTRKRG